MDYLEGINSLLIHLKYIAKGDNPMSIEKVREHFNKQTFGSKAKMLGYEEVEEKIGHGVGGCMSIWH